MGKKEMIFFLVSIFCGLLLLEGRLSRAGSVDETIALLEAKLAAAEANRSAASASIQIRNRLAGAMIQKGRETGDADYFKKAERLLDKSLEQVPGQGESLGLRAWVALFKHEFKEAAAWAEKGRAAQPKVPFHYGVLSDAFLEMGDYPRAIAAAQKMLDLKPDQGSYSRAAHLRSLHGDPEGAIELWQKAILAGSPHPENTAWCRVELGDEYFNIGKLKEAEEAYQGALETNPGYHRAWEALGRLRAAEGNFSQAAEFYQKAMAVIPSPQYAGALGDLYREMGREEEAQKQDALVEQIARLDRINQALSNRDLALFYADHDRNLDEALRLAEKELEIRKDIYTYDIVGWVYYKNKRYPDAEAAMKEALKLGTKDPRLLYHAGMVAKALGKEKEARRLFKRALKLNPCFHPLYTKSARQSLKSIG